MVHSVQKTQHSAHSTYCKAFEITVENSYDKFVQFTNERKEKFTARIDRFSKPKMNSKNLSKAQLKFSELSLKSNVRVIIN